MGLPTVSRRALLASLGAGMTVSAAGCTALPGGSGGNAAGPFLDEPERKFDADVYPYPIYGETLPTATVPDPLRGQEYTIPDELAGRDTLMTFIYTNCMTMCPRLTATLSQVATHAGEEGFLDRMAFVDVTFDPARDDADALAAYADQHSIDREKENWYFLRPESEARAKEVVTDTYGIAFQKTHPEDMDRYMFTHQGVILLANKAGTVERAYRLRAGSTVDDPVTAGDVEADLATLREREG